MHFDLAIIGYGPVGAAAANIFAAKAFNIIVIEPKKEIWDIPRAVHFDGQVQRIFPVSYTHLTLPTILLV